MVDANIIFAALIKDSLTRSKRHNFALALYKKLLLWTNDRALKEKPAKVKIVITMLVEN